MFVTLFIIVNLFSRALTDNKHKLVVPLRYVIDIGAKIILYLWPMFSFSFQVHGGALDLSQT